VNSALSMQPEGPELAKAAFGGLTAEQAKERLSECGPNDPTPVRRGALAFEILILFANPLVVILLFASLVSAILGQVVDAGIIFVLVVLGISVNFAQTYRSQRAIQKLREHVSLTATVLRDGKWQEGKRFEVVPGDVIRLSAGDLVPADGRLLEARDLYVQQAALTGESMPAEKKADAEGKSAEGPLASNLVFLGTSVVSGVGIAHITATGARTAFGAIAARSLRRRSCGVDLSRIIPGLSAYLDAFQRNSRCSSAQTPFFVKNDNASSTR
jgi:Mg2+-importing ATPase